MNTLEKIYNFPIKSEHPLMGSVHLDSRVSFKFAVKTQACLSGNPMVSPPAKPPWLPLI
jgi:hypothetical protein